ncbi:hypothetical protein SteCoe_36184 [Stentor coeruleus]|uniref:Uncharacterized protein n=1 Tax=Stentor coeruleus TaxID=5963 RepID=A0A1R2AR01_9CILI|nr:hypothetical protein SteCoe_36184 [Stentor coeruleus]
MLNKSENYELALSTTQLIPQSIFNITEVSILEKSRSSKLPKILKPITTTSSHKPSTASHLAIEESRPRSCWNSFLKRNLSRQSTVSTALLESIKKRVDDQVNEDLEKAAQSSNPIMKTIQSLENSAYVKDEIKVFEKSVLIKKNSYNKLHHDNSVKEEQLEQLEKQLETLVSQCDDYSGQQTYLKSKDHEYKTLQKRLKEHLQDQEILESMVIVRKSEYAKMSEPINKKKKKINMLSSELEKIRRDIQKEKSLIFQLKKDFRHDRQSLEALNELKEKKVKAEIKNLADKRKFRYCMKKEQEKNQMLEKHTKDAKDLLKLELKLTKMKDDELLSEEIKKIEAHCLREEQKFLEIQKVTNIVTVSEMYPHYMYLMENEARLKDSVNEALKQIETMNIEREDMGKQLENLKLRSMNNQQSSKEIQFMEEKFKKRANFIDSHEEYVEKLESVVVTAMNSISRLIYQLDLTNELGEIMTENLPDCFRRCKNKLDILIEFIKKSDFDMTESVNTDINFRKSPSFLNLNTKSFRIT